MKPDVKCINCDCAVKDLGDIPSTQIFAGRILDKLIEGGRLYKCKKCHLGFRYPRLSKIKLDDLYKKGMDGTWDNIDNLRTDWILSSRWISEYIPKQSNILDIGCYDGKFFDSLLDSYKCFGVEIHDEAKERAESKGIKIISSDFTKLDGKFNCVTAFDVIEHTENPRIFIREIYNRLDKGGICLISTGNLNSQSFKFMGGKYWYCTISEHISFLSPDWFCKKENINGFDLIKIEKFSRSYFEFKKYYIEAFLNILFKLLPVISFILKGVVKTNFDYKKYTSMKSVGPAWGAANDHFIVMLQKNE
jgi:SAM-dependent methyltransferase